MKHGQVVLVRQQDSKSHDEEWPSGLCKSCWPDDPPRIMSVRWDDTWQLVARKNKVVAVDPILPDLIPRSRVRAILDTWHCGYRTGSAAMRPCCNQPSGALNFSIVCAKCKHDPMKCIC